MTVAVSAVSFVIIYFKPTALYMQGVRVIFANICGLRLADSFQIEKIDIEKKNLIIKTSRRNRTCDLRCRRASYTRFIRAKGIISNYLFNAAGCIYMTGA